MPAAARHEEFISEPIDPVSGTGRAGRAAAGEPILPTAFDWRGQRHVIAEVVRQWKTSQPEGHRTGNEIYLRRHWYHVRTTAGRELTLYCLRKTRPGGKRWFVYSEFIDVDPTDERSVP